MAKQLQPRGTGWSAAASPLFGLVALWMAVYLVWSVWAAAWLTAWIVDGAVPSFGVAWALALFTWDTETTWPGLPTPLVMVTSVLFVGATLALVMVGLRVFHGVRGDAEDAVTALNTGDETVAELARPAAAEKALRLRRSTLLGRKARSLKDADVGLVIGGVKRPRDKSGPTLFASWEDTILAYMAPRAGKTTAMAIPYVLAAPGPALATSNKGDVWAATAELREERTGERVWLFDPQEVTHQGRGMWWNPLRGVDNVEAAHRLAGHFVLTIDDDSKKDMWGPAAKALISQLLLAAALDDETLAIVGEWLHDAKQPRPVNVLQDHGFTAYADALRETQNIVSETRDGIYTTARTAARCLDDPAIMRWVTPPDDFDVDEFDPRPFVRSRQTLHLLSKSRSAAAPLIAALTDAVFLSAEEAAEGQGGRLDPPLVAVLDEAANICKIADLPDMYSHLGSRGIIPVTILQSYRQGVRVWTENGMEAMWSAATVKVFGAGLDDHKIVEALSKLVGQHDVSTGSFSFGDGKGNHSVQLRRQEIMQGSDIRQIAKGEALLFATAARPTLVEMHPWYENPDAKEIGAAIEKAHGLITAGARNRLPHGSQTQG
ncbi:type IV secretory system conjugative DNA transfer family protein [Nocardiopsis sp. MG754419]|uniref:type IV secretory system conjugative DNA transfer family protein n=1 Tax=Nocardiopsis sp. MG754419 TaxID=2259865 RepID=UPI001BAA32A9|nr:TraM recognition domain-containing protein [Nocardiopsis sp. MG754419]MBR8741032.1 TRAG family protein [Nocardiopsis sp. MG754419]